jgi:hypothetical protein
MFVKKIVRFYKSCFCLQMHRQFFSYLAHATITGDNLAANLDPCVAITAFRSKGSLSCDMGPRLIWSHLKGWHQRPSEIQTHDARIITSLCPHSNHCGTWAIFIMNVNNKKSVNRCSLAIPPLWHEYITLMLICFIYGQTEKQEVGIGFVQ